MDKPDVDDRRISPAIAIDQKQRHNPRVQQSNVDGRLAICVYYMRVWGSYLKWRYADWKPVLEQMVNHVMAMEKTKRFRSVGADLSRSKKAKQVFEKIQKRRLCACARGWSHEVTRKHNINRCGPYRRGDRVVRLFDSIEAALRLSEGYALSCDWWGEHLFLRHLARDAASRWASDANLLVNAVWSVSGSVTVFRVKNWSWLGYRSDKATLEEERLFLGIPNRTIIQRCSSNFVNSSRFRRIFHSKLTQSQKNMVLYQFKEECDHSGSIMKMNLGRAWCGNSFWRWPWT